MKDRTYFVNLFLDEYHKPKILDMANGINKLLHTNEFYKPDNQHWQYLTYQMNRIIYEFRLSPDYELPGMVYGMYYEAFNCFLGDILNHS